MRHVIFCKLPNGTCLWQLKQFVIKNVCYNWNPITNWIVIFQISSIMSSLGAPKLFFHVTFYQFQQGSSLSLTFHNDGNNERKKGDDNSQKEIKSKWDGGN